MRSNLIKSTVLLLLTLFFLALHSLAEATPNNNNLRVMEVDYDPPPTTGQLVQFDGSYWEPRSFSSIVSATPPILLSGTTFSFDFAYNFTGGSQWTGNHLFGGAGVVTFANSPTIGIGAIGTHYRLTFDGEDSDGVIEWAEDEGWFISSLISSPDPTYGAVNTERFGALSQAGGDNATVFGNGAYGDLDSAAFGYNAVATSTSGPGLGSCAFGVDTLADEGGAAFGNGAVALAQSLALGPQASASSGMAIGTGASVTANIGGFALGLLSSCATSNTMAMGTQASIGTLSLRSMAVGVQSSIGNSVTDSVVLGFDADSSFSQTLALGSNADPTATGQALIGGSNSGSTQGTFITDVFIGKGVTNSSAAANTSINPTGGSGTNNAGSNLVINGGRGTGNVATGGSVIIQTAPLGSSGSTANTLTERANFKKGVEAVFNDGGENYDYRFEGDTDANLLITDASADRVGIGTSSPNAKLHVSGEVTVGSTGGALPASASLDLVATDKAAILNRLTTTQRDALTGVDGMVVYNSTSNTFQGRASSAWVDLAAGVTKPGVNLVIGGNFSMNPWQRGTSFTTGAAKIYTADRWEAGRGNLVTGQSVARTTLSVGDVPKALHSIRVQRIAANSSTQPVGIFQAIESSSSRLAHGKYVTLSFWYRKGANYSPPSNTIIANVYSGTGTDQNLAGTLGSGTPDGFTGITTIATTSPTPTSSWQLATVTSGSVVASSVNQLGVAFSSGSMGASGAGADDWFEVANVELIIGDTNTPAIDRTPQEERDLCERFYQKSYLDEIAPATATSNGAIQTTSGTTTSGPVTFFHRYRVPLRSTPSLTIYDTAGNSGRVTHWTTTNVAYNSILRSTVKDFGVEGDSSTSKTNGDMRFHFVANSEL